MKWMLLSLLILILPAQAVQQYTEASCILIKQQIKDYQNRLGTNSPLYLKSKANFDQHCQNPKSYAPKKSAFINNNKMTTPAKSQPIVVQPQATQKTIISPTPQTDATITTNVFSQAIAPLLPMLIMALLIISTLIYFQKRLPQIKGKLGEKYVSNGLNKHLEPEQYTIINDITLPLADGGSTQIDHVVVSNFGVFVIETKNMSGWIFDNKHQAQWTQTIYRSKHSFQNPLRQNYKHTKTLANLLELPDDKFHSIIIFTQNAKLKSQMPENVGHFTDMLSYIKSFNTEIINHKLKLRILKLIDIVRLKQGRKTDKQHIEYLKENHRANNQSY